MQKRVGCDVNEINENMYCITSCDSILGLQILQAEQEVISARRAEELIKALRCGGATAGKIL